MSPFLVSVATLMETSVLARGSVCHTPSNHHASQTESREEHTDGVPLPVGDYAENNTKHPDGVAAEDVENVLDHVLYLCVSMRYSTTLCIFGNSSQRHSSP